MKLHLLQRKKNRYFISFIFQDDKGNTGFGDIIMECDFKFDREKIEQFILSEMKDIKKMNFLCVTKL